MKAATPVTASASALLKKKASRRMTKQRLASKSKHKTSPQSTRSNSNSPEKPHVPVMPREVLDFLHPAAPHIYIDGTMGAGGHSRLIAQALARSAGSGAEAGRLYAFDRDATAFKAANSTLNEFKNVIVPVKSPFSAMADVLVRDFSVKHSSVDGILLDLGVSSMQLDQSARGFAYRLDGPLDMRMDQHSNQATAQDYLNSLSETDLALLLSHFGVHKIGLSSKLASVLVQKRKELSKFTTTKQLVDCVESTVSPQLVEVRKKLVKATFQALRIMVNDEYAELKKGLIASQKLLRPHGRLAVISFQSDEGALLKKFVNTCVGKRTEADIVFDIQANLRVNKILSRFGHPRLQYDEVETERLVRHISDLAKRRPSFVATESRSVAPQNDEVEQNPRANSAVLHCEVRSVHAPFEFPHWWL